MSCSVEAARISLEDCTCPICMCILIEPVTMPCHHELCRPCFKQNVEESSLLCPLCRTRIGTWARHSTKAKTLVNQQRWEQIQKLFPKRVRLRLEGKDEEEEDSHDVSYHHPQIHLAEPGEIRKEYEEELRKLRQQMLMEQLREEKESAALICHLQAEEHQERELRHRQQQQIHHADARLALELDKVINETGLDEPISLLLEESKSRVTRSSSATSTTSNQSTSCGPLDAFFSKYRAEPEVRCTSDPYPYPCISPKDKEGGNSKPNTTTFGKLDTGSFTSAMLTDASRRQNPRSGKPSTMARPPGKGSSTVSSFSEAVKERCDLDEDMRESVHCGSEAARERSESVDSNDSITNELAHFKPILSCPRTPPRKMADGKTIDPPVVRTTPRNLSRNSFGSPVDLVNSPRLEPGSPLMQKRLSELALERRQLVHERSRSTSTDPNTGETTLPSDAAPSSSSVDQVSARPGLLIPLEAIIEDSDHEHLDYTGVGIARDSGFRDGKNSGLRFETSTRDVDKHNHPRHKLKDDEAQILNLQSSIKDNKNTDTISPDLFPSSDINVVGCSDNSFSPHIGDGDKHEAASDRLRVDRRVLTRPTLKHKGTDVLEGNANSEIQVETHLDDSDIDRRRSEHVFDTWSKKSRKHVSCVDSCNNMIDRDVCIFGKCEEDRILGENHLNLPRNSCLARHAMEDGNVFCRDTDSQTVEPRQRENVMRKLKKPTTLAEPHHAPPTKEACETRPRQRRTRCGGAVASVSESGKGASVGEDRLKRDDRRGKAGKMNNGREKKLGVDEGKSRSLDVGRKEDLICESKDKVGDEDFTAAGNRGDRGLEEVESEDDFDEITGKSVQKVLERSERRCNKRSEREQVRLVSRRKNGCRKHACDADFIPQSSDDSENFESDQNSACGKKMKSGVSNITKPGQRKWKTVTENYQTRDSSGEGSSDFDDPTPKKMKKGHRTSSRKTSMEVVDTDAPSRKKRKGRLAQNPTEVVEKKTHLENESRLKKGKTEHLLENVDPNMNLNIAVASPGKGANAMKRGLSRAESVTNTVSPRKKVHRKHDSTEDKEIACTSSKSRRLKNPAKGRRHTTCTQPSIRKYLSGSGKIDTHQGEDSDGERNLTGTISQEEEDRKLALKLQIQFNLEEKFKIDAPRFKGSRDQYQLRRKPKYTMSP